MAFSGYFEAPVPPMAESGLFSVAEVIRYPETESRWTFGFDQEYTMPDGVKIIPSSNAGDVNDIPGLVPDDKGVKGATFEVVIDETYSGMGANKIRPNDMLEAIMDSATQRAIEYVLWGGQSIADVEGAHWLFDDDAITIAGGADARANLAAAEHSMTTSALGLQGAIHMDRGLASELGSALQYRNGAVFTRLGTPVVAGTGYGVGGRSEAMAVTGPIIVHLGPIVVNSQDPRDNFDPRTNTYTVRVSRVASVTFDPSLHTKINV
jgi:hypothetical protein